MSTPSLNRRKRNMAYLTCLKRVELEHRKCNIQCMFFEIMWCLQAVSKMLFVKCYQVNIYFLLFSTTKKTFFNIHLNDFCLEGLVEK